MVEGSERRKKKRKRRREVEREGGMEDGARSEDWRGQITPAGDQEREDAKGPEGGSWPPLWPGWPRVLWPTSGPAYQVCLGKMGDGGCSSVTLFANNRHYYCSVQYCYLPNL